MDELLFVEVYNSDVHFLTLLGSSWQTLAQFEPSRVDTSTEQLTTHCAQQILELTAP